jgi:hypothetical protein
MSWPPSLAPEFEPRLGWTYQNLQSRPEGTLAEPRAAA